MTDCREIVSDFGRVCAEHGDAWTAAGCVDALVLKDVSEHRAWQFNRWGANRDVPNGTGPRVGWLDSTLDAARRSGAGHLDAATILDLFRQEWDFPKDGDPTAEAKAAKGTTWLRMVREELAEAACESDQEALYEELTQVAALCVNWMGKIRERRIWQWGVAHVERPDDVYDGGWHSYAEVMAEQHGMGHKGPVRIVRRRPGQPWEDVTELVQEATR